MSRREKTPKRDKQSSITEKAVQREIRRVYKGRRRKRFCRAAMVCLIIALFVGWWMGQNVFMVVTVRDGAMSPTIEAGSKVICLRENFLSKMIGIVSEETVRLKRGTVCLIAYDDGSGKKPSLMIRRVLALPGDVIDLKDGVFSVNGENVPGNAFGGDRVYPVTVKTGQLFLIGDQRAVSVDSFRRSFGMPSLDSVIARPVAVIWPLYSAGLVK